MRHKTVLEKDMHRGFRKGLNAVAMGDVKKLREELKAVIGGQTACKMQYYINGTTIIRQDVAKKIEQIFKRRGINPEDLWDI